MCGCGYHLRLGRVVCFDIGPYTWKQDQRSCKDIIGWKTLSAADDVLKISFTECYMTAIFLFQGGEYCGEASQANVNKILQNSKQ